MKVVFVDVFTSEKFKGNNAAVCFTGGELAPAFMQALAAELSQPVTGSAHAVLAPFWAERLGKRAFVAYQASARGGVVHLRLEGERAVIGGAGVTVLRGELS
jgi:predicted PhzF superfamily epimerase YddE/YHI9